MVKFRTQGPCQRAFVGLCSALSIIGIVSSACAASDWAPGAHSAVRLLDGGPDIAGVEIRLAPGFITYWRTAGDAGVPPRFDFTASTNVKAVEVLYPAPRLLDEDGTAAYGYSGGVTMPVRVTPIDAASPVRLDLKLDYAVCSRLCLPADAHVALPLDAGADASAVIAAVAEVPKLAAVGGPGPVGIETVAWTPGGTIRVEARVPGGVATLFVEAPDPWYFAASPGSTTGENRVAFVLTGRDPPPVDPLPAAPLRLTLVSPSASIEVSLPLDAIAAKP